MTKKQYIEVGKSYSLKRQPKVQVEVSEITRKGRGYTIHYHFVGRRTANSHSLSVANFSKLIA